MKKDSLSGTQLTGESQGGKVRHHDTHIHISIFKSTDFLWIFRRVLGIVQSH
jgi:hypothetical protein